jgi:hypothetical protein
MNDTDTRRDPLAGTRPTFFPNPTDAADPVRRDQDLLAILAEPRPASARRSDTPRRLRLAAAAAAVLAAVTVATALPDEQQTPAPDASARQVLLAAAHATATTQEPATGRYWHERTREGGVDSQGDGADRFRMTWESSAENWWSGTGKDPSVQLSGIYTNRPFSPQDRPEWSKVYPPEPPAPPSATRIGGEPMFYFTGFKLTMSELRALPTTAEALETWLLDRYREIPPDEPWRVERTEWLVWEAVQLLSQVPATSGTRSAAYEMLANLPGFRAMDASELPNESLVGVARTTRRGPGDVGTGEDTVHNGVVDQQVIIDPDTGKLVTDQYVLVEPGSEATPYPPGTVLYYTTVEHAGWLDTEPVLPPDAIVEEIPSLGGG